MLEISGNSRKSKISKRKIVYLQPFQNLGGRNYELKHIKTQWYKRNQD